jgi:thiaminase
MIDYWADASYVAAVDATGDLVNEWYLTFQGDIDIAEQVFLQTLDKEDGFWKSVDAWEEGSVC